MSDKNKIKSLPDIGVTEKEYISAGKAFGFTAKEMAEGMRKIVRASPTCKQALENLKAIKEKGGRTRRKIPTIYYVCPFDNTYSGKMQYCGKIKITHLTFDEVEVLKDSPIIRERLQCPKCQRVFGWHQLKQIKK